MNKLFLFFCGAVLLSCTTAYADETPKPQPTTYELKLIYIFEGNPKQPEYILTIGQSGFRSVDAMKQAIANFPEGSTLRWAPNCDQMGGEPLSTQQELGDLRIFCEQHKIKFVHIPSG